MQTKYVLNGFPYLGKDDKKSDSQPLGEYVVLRLIEPYTMAGRNVTTDNFFTSIPLALKLLSKRTSLVGTIRGNKKGLPSLCKTKKDTMPRFSTVVYKTGNMSLTVYKSKPKKKVVILSTKHKSVVVAKKGKCLPESIEYYNSTKCVVDIADQMAKKYSVKSASRRWPLHVFFNILDFAGINAWILYKETTGINISRKRFLFYLAKELTEEWIETKTEKVPKNISGKEELLKTISEANDQILTRKWCQVGYCNNNKTKNMCYVCKKNVCGKCGTNKGYICKKCFANECM